MTFPWRVLKDRLSVTSHRTITLSAGAAPRVLASLCAGALLLLAALSPAFAQGRLDAHYEATLAGHSGRQGRLDHRDRRRPVFRLRLRRHGGIAEGVFRRHRHRRGAGPRRQRRAGGDQLFREHHDVEENRSHPHGAVERQCQGIRHRAGAAGRSGPASASPMRIAAACSIR